MTGRVEIYSNGVVCCSVCAPKYMTAEEVTQEVNNQNPTGIDGAWQVADEPFKGGTANPHECEEKSTHQHWLMVC